MESMYPHADFLVKLLLGAIALLGSLSLMFLGVVGYYLKKMSDAIGGLTVELAALRVHVAQDYILKEDCRNIRQECRASMAQLKGVNQQ